MNQPNRCKCGKFTPYTDCPDCRKRRKQEDKTVKFLIGEIVRPVKEPVKVPVDVGMVWCG